MSFFPVILFKKMTARFANEGYKLTKWENTSATGIAIRKLELNELATDSTTSVYAHTRTLTIVIRGRTEQEVNETHAASIGLLAKSLSSF